MSIHKRVAWEVERYDQYANWGRTQHTRAEVESAYADLLSAESELYDACAEANVLLNPHDHMWGVDAGYERLYDAVNADTPWAQPGKLFNEMYPLGTWQQCAKKWRSQAARIRRETARVAAVVTA